MRRFIPFIILLLFISACGAGQGTTPAVTATIPTNDSAMDWNVKMTHSGGIMGLLRHIEVNSSGQFTVLDEISKQTKEGTLSQAELKTLADLVLTLKPLEIVSQKDFACADCFVYNIEIQQDGKPISVELNDISLSDSGYELLVTELRKIIEQELK